MKNINNKTLKVCSKNPLTGFNRDGYCRKSTGDYGNHLVCAKVDKEFLDYTAKKGNDLSSVVKPGDKWCLCQDRYYEAYRAKRHPQVIESASSIKIKPYIKKIIFQSKHNKKGGRLLPKLRELSKKNKKHIYKLYDPQYKRILAIEEGINDKKNNTIKDKKNAAKMKKARFNILRLYRKNKDKKGCKNLTQDMKYIDMKYKLGNTNNICGGKNKSGKNKSGKNKSRKNFLYNPDDPKRSFDVYIDKNPDDTITIKYKTIDDIKNTIKKLERLYKTKKYSHKRIWQVGMIMKVRMEAMLKHHKTRYKNAKNVKQRYNLSNKYYKFLGKRSKAKTFKERKKMIFTI